MAGLQSVASAAVAAACGNSAPSSLGRRCLHLSPALLRIPRYHRLRYKRTLQVPYHQVRYADEDPNSVNNSQGHLFPLDGSLATTRQTPAEELLAAMLAKRSLPGKLHVLNESESNMWYRRLDLPLAHPCCLPLAQALCQANIDTRLFGDAPASADGEGGGGITAAASAQVVTNVPGVYAQETATSRLSSDQRGGLVSAVVAAVRALESQHRWPVPPDARLASRMQQRRICVVMETLLLGCARAGILSNPEDLQAEESSLLQMFARYFGLHASASKRLLLPDLASMRTGHFVIRAPIAWQLRSRCPLRPLARSTGTSRPPPDWPYNPDILGLAPEIDHLCFHEAGKQQFQDYGDRVLRPVAGHITDDAYGPGDPCEFGHLLAINGDDTAGGETPPVDFMRPENWPALTCDALLRLYASTAAQAFNCGFNWVTNLRLGDRPFVTHAASFVGDRLKLSAFQLATVAGGGRDSAGDSGSQGDGSNHFHVTNLMWTQPEPVLLWQREPKTGRLTEANARQLMRLADLLCAPRCSREEAAESRPFLDGAAPCSRSVWIGGGGETAAAYKPPEDLELLRPPRKPRTVNYMYLLDPVVPRTLYRTMQSHPGFPRLPAEFEARAEAHHLARERARRGRRKVVRKPMLLSDSFP